MVKIVAILLSVNILTFSVYRFVVEWQKIADQIMRSVENCQCVW
jgi:hypothetical protein